LKIDRTSVKQQQNFFKVQQKEQ